MTGPRAVAERRVITRRQRFEILRRDGYACRYCGATAPDATLEVDHVVPVALGGNDEPSNLITACRDCNAGKASTTPDSTLVAEVDATAARWAEAVKAAGELRNSALERDRATIDRFDAVWRSWKSGQREVPRSGNWPRTILNYVAGGLTDVDLADHVRTAMTSTAPTDATWRYFCTVCKNEVERRHKLALQILTSPDGLDDPSDGWPNVRDVDGLS